MSASRTSTQERKTHRASLGFPRDARITRGAELQRIAREGKRFRTAHLEVRVAGSPLALPASATRAATRVGLIVPRFKHSAVDRNRLKRRLRELSRHHLLPLSVQVSIVLRARPEAYGATFAALRDDALRVARGVTRLLGREPAPDAAP